MRWLPVFPFGMSAFRFKGAGHFGVPTVELCPMMRFIQNHVSLSVQAGLALFGAVLLWSSSFIALKIAVSAFDPMVMVFGRMLSSLVALMLLRVTVWRRAEAPMLLDRRVTRREWKYIVLLALCEPCFYFVFEGYAMIYTTASQAGWSSRRCLWRSWSRRGCCSANAAPARLDRVCAGRRRGRLAERWIRSHGSAPNPIFGNFLEVLAMLCGALYVVCAKQLSSRCSPVLITTMQSLIGLLFFLCLLPLPAVNFRTVSPCCPRWPYCILASA